MRRKLTFGCSILALILLALGCLATAVLIHQARRTPSGNPEYVALGSSFAAGAGLGTLQKGSPLLCARSVGGYPQKLARMLKLSIVDMSCGGAKTVHLLRGGQFFQGPQVRMVNGDTRLVTITVGGNDIGYIGDLSLLAARHDDNLLGWVIRRFWSGPRSLEERDWSKLQQELQATLQLLHSRAPAARIVVATYPKIVPPSGSCSRIGLTKTEAQLIRNVGDRLAATTRSVAESGGAILVDMNAIGSRHNACSNQPWVNGYSGIAPFHPAEAGARATAGAIADALRRSPAAVAAVRQHNAPRHQAGRFRRQE